MRKLLTPIAVLTLTAFFLAGCNLPLGQQGAAAIQTEAAVTVAAQLTAAASSATASLTAAPFPTLAPATATATVQPVTQGPPPTSTTTCDKGTYVADITYPDNTSVDSGTTFTKTWQLKNIGSCSWTTAYALVFAGGDSMSGPAAQALTANVDPGQTVNVSVNLTAPAANGTYTGNWSLRNGSGVVFYSGFYVKIIVGGGGGGGAFSVTHVAMSVTGGCGAFHTAVSITTNGAGIVNYHKIFSDGGLDNAPGTMTFASAGTQSFSFDDSESSPGTAWVDLYIDSPNHQQFGRANFTCP